MPMNLSKPIRNILQSDWCIAFFILLIFFATYGYQYGWDDQHLEIPLLKSLIDNTLYQGDYYVQSLQKNFTSYFYPVLAKLITIDQIPAAYFLLFILSRYFLFFWAYKLWHLISKKRLTSFLCVTAFMLLSRVPEFLYRTFSHQEFALAFVFAGIYFFYKERFLLASIILGATANFHALYSLFPMLYLAGYLLFYYKRHGWAVLVKCCMAFCVFALPFLIWTLQNKWAIAQSGYSYSSTNWLYLYQIGMVQNFPTRSLTLTSVISHLKDWILVTQEYWLLVILYILNIRYNPAFRNDAKIKSMCIVVFFLLSLTYIFTYFIPVKFIIDLNLVRNTQFLHFFLLGYTVFLITSIIDREKLNVGLGIVVFLGLFRFSGFIAALSALAIFFFLELSKTLSPEEKEAYTFRQTAFMVGFLSALIGIVATFRVFIPPDFVPSTTNKFLFMLILTCGGYTVLQYLQTKKEIVLPKIILLIIPFVVMFASYTRYHYQSLKVQQTSSGFWELQRNWVDIQKFAQKYTPKDALFLVPYDMEMGGFRIFSERPVVCSFRDLGILSFDYEAALETVRRITDIEAFRVASEDSKLKAVMKAILKYRADYVVFMSYYSPQRSQTMFRKVYENKSFTVFRIPARPAQQKSIE